MNIKTEMKMKFKLDIFEYKKEKKRQYIMNGEHQTGRGWNGYLTVWFKPRILFDMNDALLFKWEWILGLFYV